MIPGNDVADRDNLKTSLINLNTQGLFNKEKKFLIFDDDGTFTGQKNCSAERYWSFIRK